MKKKILGFVICIIIVFFPITTYASPKEMADGSIFDAEYYKKNNPDVVAVLGDSEEALYQHYLKYGKEEGRLPYDQNIPALKAQPVNSGRYDGTAGYTTSNFSSNEMIRNLEIGYLNHDYALIRDTVCGKGFMDMCKPYFTINTKNAYNLKNMGRDEDNYVLPSDVVHIKVSHINNINCTEVVFITSNPAYQILIYNHEGSIPSNKYTEDSDAFRLTCQTGTAYTENLTKIVFYPAHIQLFNLLPNNTISVYTDTNKDLNGTFSTYQPYGLYHNTACDNTVMY